jgi:ATP-binding cassette subfamily B protein/subfamily B ATP-binding cassette protein MsbA
LALTRWPGLAVVFALMCCTTFLESLKPWPLKLIVDHVLPRHPFDGPFVFLNQISTPSHPFRLLLLLTSGTVVVFLAAWLFRAAQSYLAASLGASLSYGLARNTFEHLQRLTLSFHRRHKTGDLVKRVTQDTECIRQLTAQVGLPLLSSLLSLAIMLVIMSHLNSLLAMVAAAVIPLLGWAIWHFARPMNERTAGQYALQGEVMALAEQTLTALPVVKAYTREIHEDRRFNQLWSRADDAYLGAVTSGAQFRISTGAVTALGTAALMAVGGWQVSTGKISVGDLIVFLSYLTYLYTPLETLAYLSSGLAAVNAGAQRVSDVLDSPDAVPEGGSGAELGRSPRLNTPAAQWDHVTFGYRQGEPVLSGVCLELKHGERLALVGATGAGKSTLVSLLPRFYDAWQGAVRVSGADVREVDLNSLRNHISVVLQDPQLFPWSVAENIGVAKPSGSLAEIEAAARAARCHDFISKLPQGYQTVLAERGAGLSLGERQRLALARAFLKDAPVLILDEPASALDSETEHLLFEAKQALMQGRSVILIAHRLSTVRQADRIAVLEHGRIIETGSHDELLNRVSRYARLFRVPDHAEPTPK